MKTLLILIFIAAVVSDAAGDSLNHSHKLEWSHFFQALSVFFLLIAGIIFKYVDNMIVKEMKLFWEIFFSSVNYLLLYSAQRFLLFDFVWNFVHKPRLSPWYVGSTGFLDKLKKRFQEKYGPLLWIRIVYWLLITGGILFNYT